MVQGSTGDSRREFGSDGKEGGKVRVSKVGVDGDGKGVASKVGGVRVSLIDS